MNFDGNKFGIAQGLKRRFIVGKQVTFGSFDVHFEQIDGVSAGFLHQVLHIVAL